MRLPGPSATATAAVPSRIMNSSRFKACYRTVPVGLPMGAVGCVLVPLVVPPGAVLPVPARSAFRHLSLSVPIRFSHLPRPPTAEGGVIGVGVTTGASDGVTLGVCDGVTLGVCEGVALGVSEGVTLGVLCAKATPASASRAAVVRVLSMMAPLLDAGDCCNLRAAMALQAAQRLLERR